MNRFLLDVNLLIALLWPPHEAHARAQRWFSHHAGQGWASCAITQAGFVRIVSNPSFSQRPISPHDAMEVLGGSLKHPGHRFWTEDIGIREAVALCGRQLTGHQQITDAYLLGLAIHKKGKLATLDARVKALITDDSVATGVVMLL